MKNTWENGNQDLQMEDEKKRRRRGNQPCRLDGKGRHEAELTDVDETGDQIFTLAKLLTRLLLTWGSGNVSQLMINMSSACEESDANNIFSSGCVFVTILTMMKRKFKCFQKPRGTS